MASRLIDFYLNQKPDAAGRSIAEIWTWNETQLENCHDYIQWLFPLPEASAFNPNAPRLTPTDIETFGSSSELRNRLLQSLKLMLNFYGLQLHETPLEITESENFAQHAANWLDCGNHNHLRLTRILRCLTLLGLNEFAQALFDCLSQIYQAHPQRISDRSFAFWQAAVRETD